MGRRTNGSRLRRSSDQGYLDAENKGGIIRGPRQSDFFVFDSCFAGTIFTDRGPADLQPLSPDRVAQLLKKQSRDFLTAGSDNQTVPAHTPLPDLLLAAINGAADPYKLGVVSPDEIRTYLLTQIRGFNLTPQEGRLYDPAFAEGSFLFRILPPAVQGQRRSQSSPIDRRLCKAPSSIAPSCLFGYVWAGEKPSGLSEPTYRLKSFSTLSKPCRLRPRRIMPRQ